MLDSWRTPAMLWFYTRSDQQLDVITRYDNRTAEYVLIVSSADGRCEEERFATGWRFRQRLLELESHLAADKWALRGQPRMLPDGWPRRRPKS
jgi:hypothetical protein